MVVYMKIGKAMKTLRELKGMTQDEMAEKIKYLYKYLCTI